MTEFEEQYIEPTYTPSGVVVDSVEEITTVVYKENENNPPEQKPEIEKQVATEEVVGEEVKPFVVEHSNEDLDDKTATVKRGRKAGIDLDKIRERTKRAYFMLQMGNSRMSILNTINAQAEEKGWGEIGRRALDLSLSEYSDKIGTLSQKDISTFQESERRMLIDHLEYWRWNCAKPVYDTALVKPNAQGQLPTKTKPLTPLDIAALGRTVLDINKYIGELKGLSSTNGRTSVNINNLNNQTNNVYAKGVEELQQERERNERENRDNKDRNPQIDGKPAGVLIDALRDNQ